MTDALWTRLADLVPDALERPPTERDAFLRQACTDDALGEELLAEARSLVAAAEAADRDAILDPPVPELDGAPVLPDRIGPVPRDPAGWARAAWASSTAPSAPTARFERDGRAQAASARRGRRARAAAPRRAPHPGPPGAPRHRAPLDAGGRPTTARPGLRHGTRRRRAAHRVGRRAALDVPARVALSATCPTRSPTRTGSWSSTATSSRPTCSWPTTRRAGRQAARLRHRQAARPARRRRPDRDRRQRPMTPAYAAPEQVRGERGHDGDRRLRARRAALRAPHRPPPVRPLRAGGRSRPSDRLRDRRRRRPRRAAPAGRAARCGATST